MLQMHLRRPATVRRLWGVLLAACAASCTVAGAQAQALLIQNVRPVDALHGTRESQDVLVRDGRIVSMGNGIEVPADAEVIAGEGRFIAPGLWDMHVHFTYDARFTDAMADLFLDYGITSVRDTGGVLDRLMPVLEGIAMSTAPMPRVFFSGPLLDGSPVVYDGEHAPLLGIENATPAAARANVQRLAEAGVDFIKIYELVSPAVFDALVEAAGAAGLPIAAHVPLSLTASIAAPRVQSMEHLRNIELDCAGGTGFMLQYRRKRLAAPAESGYALRSEIHRMQRNAAIANENPEYCARVLAALQGTIQVPTARLNAMTQFPPFENAAWPDALDRLPPEIAREWRRAPEELDESAYAVLGQWTLDMLPRLRDAGVPIGAGTDTPIGWAVPGHSLHSELEVFVAAGLSPQEALASATLVPPRFFGLEQEMGAVAEGYRADLLLLDGNPLEEISNTRRISAVIVDGQLARGASLVVQ